MDEIGTERKRICQKQKRLQAFACNLLISNNSLGWLMGLEPTTTGITILFWGYLSALINIDNSLNGQQKQRVKRF
jgi:hypothetical protein